MLTQCGADLDSNSPYSTRNVQTSSRVEAACLPPRFAAWIGRYSRTSFGRSPLQALGRRRAYGTARPTRLAGPSVCTRALGFDDWRSVQSRLSNCRDRDADGATVVVASAVLVTQNARDLALDRPRSQRD